MSAARDPASVDASFMDAALSIGRRRLGLTGENPAVGALVVRDGVVVGQGFTEAGGRPHAEPMALAAAGDLARGATLYVTLEPCSHHGRSPPCADAVIAAGVARVVSAMEDPNPKVAGQGHVRLRAAGIEVVTGVREAAARRAHRGHILRITQARPMVTLKLAETRDGFAAGGPHDRRLAITGVAANGLTHAMRATHDAIMVGAGTVHADDPLMTVRLPGVERRPLRVVLDAAFSLPLRSRLVASLPDAPALAIGAEGADAAQIAALEAAGVETARVPRDAAGRLDLRACLSVLFARGSQRVFSEGGPRIAASLIAEGLADEVVLFTAERPLGRAGVPSLSPAARAALDDSARYALAVDEAVGADRHRRYERLD